MNQKLISVTVSHVEAALSCGLTGRNSRRHEQPQA
jgi:hypothetical protein